MGREASEVPGSRAGSAPHVCPLCHQQLLLPGVAVGRAGLPNSARVSLGDGPRGAHNAFGVDVLLGCGRGLGGGGRRGRVEGRRSCLARARHGAAHAWLHPRTLPYAAFFAFGRAAAPQRAQIQLAGLYWAATCCAGPCLLACLPCSFCWPESGQCFLGRREGGSISTYGRCRLHERRRGTEAACTTVSPLTQAVLRRNLVPWAGCARGSAGRRVRARQAAGDQDGGWMRGSAAAAPGETRTD